MKIWFHNTWFKTHDTSTSNALDHVHATLTEHKLDAREFSVKHVPDNVGQFDVRLGLLGVVAKSPLEAYNLVSRVLESHFSEVVFDSYTIDNLTVQFLVSQHLEPKKGKL